MKWMRTLKWLKVISMMQTKDRMSLMRNHMALSFLVFLGRSYLYNNAFAISHNLIILIHARPKLFHNTAMIEKSITPKHTNWLPPQEKPIDLKEFPTKEGKNKLQINLFLTKCFLNKKCERHQINNKS